MLNVYKRFWQVNWAEQWQYRANLIMYLAFWVVSPIVYLSVWMTVANLQGTVNGMTANDFAAYYLLGLLVDLITSSITFHLFTYKVQDGSLSGELLRPSHPVLTNALINNIAFKALMLIVFIPIWLVLIIVFQPQFTVTWGSILLTIPALILGFATSFLMESGLSLLVFWTTRAYGPMQVFWTAGSMLSGKLFPLTLLPLTVQSVAQFLPFQLWVWFPVQLLSNKLTPEAIALNFGLEIAWLLVLFVLFQALWKRGVRKFSAVGA